MHCRYMAFVQLWLVVLLGVLEQVYSGEFRQACCPSLSSNLVLTVTCVCSTERDQIRSGACKSGLHSRIAFSANAKAYRTAGGIV